MSKSKNRRRVAKPMQIRVDEDNTRGILRVMETTRLENRAYIANAAMRIGLATILQTGKLVIPLQPSDPSGEDSTVTPPPATGTSAPGSQASAPGESLKPEKKKMHGRN
jgi:hypothetical protein